MNPFISTNFSRICPRCDNTIFYTHKSCLKEALQNPHVNLGCNYCKTVPDESIPFLKLNQFVRFCPKCKNKIFHKYI